MMKNVRHSVSFLHLGALRLSYAGILAMPLLMLTACRTTPTVPNHETAFDQARVAQTQFQRAQATIDEAARREEMRRAIAGFQRVVERFPDDRVFTPASHLMIGEIHFQLNEFRAAERAFRETVRRYPDIPDVHSAALFGLGETLRSLNQGPRSKEVYKQLIDIYQGTTDPQIRRIVDRARVRYDEIL